MGPPPPSLAVPLLLYQARHGGAQEEAKGSPVPPVPCVVPSPFLHLGRHLVMSGDILVVSAGWRVGVGELLLAFNEWSPGMLLKILSCM